MRRPETVNPVFVDEIPSQLTTGNLYVSMRYGTAVHLCCCGCRGEVVTPFSPTDWKLSYDGESISLHPSIGNWSLACESHYWIIGNDIHWAEHWSRERIAAGRAFDRETKDAREKRPVVTDAAPARGTNRPRGLWRRLVNFLD